MKYFTTALVAAATLTSSALGAALPLEPRDVFVPPITYPHSGTVWYTGQRHNVTWATDPHPVNITNSKGMIVMAQGGLTFVTGPGSLASPLAHGFDILLGRIEVAVPDVPTAADYQLVLFGDSGNYSPNFTIINSDTC